MANLNAALIDQRVNQLINDLRLTLENDFAIFVSADYQRAKSLAFLYLCIHTLLDLERDDILDCLTDGGNDFGVDAMHLTGESDGEFTVTLFQSKYHQSLEATKAFSGNGVDKALNALRYLFDPNANLNLNKRLLIKIEEARSRIRDGLLPRVRVVLCSNGTKWDHIADDRIKNERYGDQVSWEYINHDLIISILQATKPVSDTLQFTGKAVVEDFDFSRVLIGKMAITDLAVLVNRHGDRLLERNIRRYLGLSGNRVNEAIQKTLEDEQERKNFYFYNNGVTLTCSKFTYNALQNSDYSVKVEDLQLINGGQTSITIARVIEKLDKNGDFFSKKNIEKAFVLVRLYELPQDRLHLVENITFATNSQNPVDLRDLRANDDIQKRLEMDVQQLGYSYKRKRGGESVRQSADEISLAVAAEAILAIWRKEPHRSKFFEREHFGKLYEKFFDYGLNGAQLILATFIYRVAETKRKRPDVDSPEFMPYASRFIAMRMGQYLLRDSFLDSNIEIDHTNFSRIKKTFEGKAESYFLSAERDIKIALDNLYGRNEKLSLQRLSATFRRGDLIEELDRLPLRKKLLRRR
jgi:hypothetical protein